MVRHTAESYREAALEHLATARALHRASDWGAAHYWSGLAVECMLRGYRMLHGGGFESRHDLAKLADEARILDLVGVRYAPQLLAALGTVRQRWSNDLRYRPARLVLRWLDDRGVDRTVQGDKLKYSSRELLLAAEAIVQIGERQWPAP